MDREEELKRIQQHYLDRTEEIIDKLLANDKEKNMQNNRTNRFCIVAVAIVLSIFFIGYWSSSYFTYTEENINKNVNENTNKNIEKSIEK